MHCWNGLSEAQQRKLIERGTLNAFDRGDSTPTGDCQNGATLMIETMHDEAPGPRFYCLPCAAEYLREMAATR